VSGCSPIPFLSFPRVPVTSFALGDPQGGTLTTSLCMRTQQPYASLHRQDAAASALASDCPAGAWKK